MREKTELICQRLCVLSEERRTDPETLFSWAATPNRDRIATSSVLCALDGHPVLGTLTDEQMWKMHLLEAAQFFAVNIAGERALCAGIRSRLHDDTLRNAHVDAYLSHFLLEEEEHTRLFERFCHTYVGSVFPCLQPRFHREHADGEEDFLFFARVLLFEEIADVYNRHVAGDDAVWSLVRAIHRYHSEDEARHLAFGRTVVADLWEEHAHAWPVDVLDRVRAHLVAFREATLRSYVNPRVFRDAGIPGDAFVLREEVLRSPARAELHAMLTAKSDRFMKKLGVLE